jgi:hypothetical protein
MQKKNRRTRRQRDHSRGFFIGGEGGDKCIFVPLGGGLGNQMYVYAASITVKNKLGLPLCILPIRDNKRSETDYRKILFKQGRPIEPEEIGSRMNAATKVLNAVKNPHNEWNSTQLSANTSKNVLLAGGFFQSYNSIKSAIPTIRADCKEVFEERYVGFKDKIAPSSAFIHVRKGDYGSASLAADYYKRGLLILEAVPEITDIYILSDDIAWCKEQGFSSPKLRWFDNPEDSKDELKAMYLMTLCLGGACISASTFSSWGAILGADQNEKSTIIYPKKWSISHSNSSAQKFPARWKAI